MHPHRRLQCLIAVVLAMPSVSGSAQAGEPLYLAPRLAVAPQAKIPAGLADCRFGQELSEVLRLALKRDGAVFAAGPVPTSKGRSLKVELVEFALAGNGFLGHALSMRFRVALYQDGRKVAAFTDQTSFNGNGMVTACAEVRTFMAGQASQIAKWVRTPVDGQELKRWGE